jgi:hypothetical protein
VPSPIYKYFGRYGIDVLENLEIKVTPPNQFNDLFEVTPRPSNESLSREAFDEHIESEAGQRWLNFKLSTSDKFRAGYATFRGSREAFYQFAVPLMPSVKQQVCFELLDAISNHFGIICFSKDPRHLLMWSHYSEGHKGMVIGFDSQELDLPSIDPVDYVSHRTEHNPPWTSTDRERMKAIITSKSKLWGYEGELRAMLKLERLQKRPLSDGSVVYFHTIRAPAIVDVIFGFRSLFAQRARAAVEKNAIACSIRRAKPHPTEFAVVIDDEP